MCRLGPEFLKGHTVAILDNFIVGLLGPVKLGLKPVLGSAEGPNGAGASSEPWLHKT